MDTRSLGTTYQGGVAVNVQGSLNTIVSSKNLNVQGAKTLTYGTANVEGRIVTTAPLRNVQGTLNTTDARPLNIQSKGNYRTSLTGTKTYTVPLHGKVKKATEKPKEKVRPSIDPLIFPHN